MPWEWGVGVEDGGKAQEIASWCGGVRGEGNRVKHMISLGLQVGHR